MQYFNIIFSYLQLNSQPILSLLAEGKGDVQEKETLAIFTGHKAEERFIQTTDKYLASFATDISELGIYGSPEKKDIQIDSIRGLIQRPSLICAYLDNNENLIIEWSKYLSRMSERGLSLGERISLLGKKIPPAPPLFNIVVGIFDKNIPDPQKLIKKLKAVKPPPPDDVMRVLSKNLLTFVLAPGSVCSGIYTSVQRELYEGMKKLHAAGYLLAAGTGRFSENEDSAGLVPTHAYAVIGFKTIGNLQLIILRNPWEWKGRDIVNDSMGRLKAIEVEQPIFHLDLADFTRFFSSYSVSKNPFPWKLYLGILLHC